MSDDQATALRDGAGTEFEALERDLREHGPGEAIDRLIATLSARDEPRALLDALLLKARHELGLPPVQDGAPAEMPEPVRSQYEERYVEAIRQVGSKLLESGDLVGAWPYFRAIGEKEPIARALDAYQPEEGDERIGQVVEIAFNGGAHPRRGFELILSQYGACSAITAFDHLPPDDATRDQCAALLIRNLHAHLTESLRADIARRGQPLPPEGTRIPELIDGRPWLFADDGYHLDVSHLAAVVRMALLATDPEVLRLAVELTDYGRNLSERHRYESEPPFERTYEDHAIYLRAVLGEDIDAAVAHFRGKLPPTDPDGISPSESAPAQVLVRLLARVGRLDEAIDVAAERLAGLPESAMFCPSLAQLCLRAGRLDRLAQVARDRGDLVGFAAGLMAGEMEHDR
jgi:hypothetical protein